MTVVLTKDKHESTGDDREVVVLDPAPHDEPSHGIDPAAVRRIALKLLWALVLILVLMLFSADEVDFVYKGF